MRRPKPQPINTRLPQLRNAMPGKRADSVTPEHKSHPVPAERVGRGKTLRLRKVHRD
ncbi:MAG: hypothetical protein ACREH8_14335 [Opitutaceae bacterium]